MRKQTREKRVIWHGRTREEKLFTSSFEIQIPHLIQVHLPSNRVIFCELYNVNQVLENRLYQDFGELKPPSLNYGELKGGE